MRGWNAIGFFATVLMFGPTAPAAFAEEAAPAPTGCAALLGDLWNDPPDASAALEIDGTALASPDALDAALRKRGDRPALVRGGSFSGWDFRAVDAANSCFVEADLSQSNWTGASAPGVGFVKSDLSGASLKAASMPGVLLRDARLEGTDAQGADFSGGRFDGGWFEGTVAGFVLDGANLSGFRFDCGITLDDGCPVYTGDAPLSARGTDFTSADLSSYGFYGVDLAGATLDGTRLAPGQLPVFAAASFKGPVHLVGGQEVAIIDPEEARALIADAADAAAAMERPSFDCGRATTDAETLICGEQGYTLRDLDRRLGQAYALARSRAGNPGALAASQRSWIAERNACLTDEYPSSCMEAAYDERIAALTAMIGETDWLAPGEDALFVDDVLPLSEAMRATPLFARLMPVMAAASMSQVQVGRNADGSYRARGEAVGANAHLCSLSADGMQLEGKNGWYSVVADDSDTITPIMRLIGDHLQIIGNGHPDYETYPDASDYVGCGVRAGFPILRRIPLGEAQMQSYRTTGEEATDR